MYFNEYLILLALYILTCLWVIHRYYKRDLGAFQAPFIFSLASMLMMTPQFCVIIYNPYYDPDLLWDLSYCMITGTLAFSFGWEKAQNTKYRSCTDINLERVKTIVIILFLFGVYTVYCSAEISRNNYANDGGDIRDNHEFQVLNFFRIFFDFGMFFSLVYVIKKNKVPTIIYVMLAISTLYYFYVIITLARRAITVKLFLSLGLLISMVKPKYANKIKNLVIIFFTLGTVYQASIGEIRSNLITAEENDISIWENYKKSFTEPNMSRGMDLGNGALFIKYTKDNWTYNGGLFLWDDIVTWYFPSFIFGKEGKENLKVATANNKYIESITQGVTTQTGYYQSFSAFGYLGFILFYILGMGLGMIWKKSKNSSLFLILYLSFMFNIPNLASHGFNYIIGQIECFVIFCLPFIYKYTYRKKLLTR